MEAKANYDGSNYSEYQRQFEIECSQFRILTAVSSLLLSILMTLYFTIWYAFEPRNPILMLIMAPFMIMMLLFFLAMRWELSRRWKNPIRITQKGIMGGHFMPRLGKKGISWDEIESVMLADSYTRIVSHKKSRFSATFWWSVRNSTLGSQDEFVRVLKELRPDIRIDDKKKNEKSMENLVKNVIRFFIYIVYPILLIMFAGVTALFIKYYIGLPFAIVFFIAVIIVLWIVFRSYGYQRKGRQLL